MQADLQKKTTLDLGCTVNAHWSIFNNPQSANNTTLLLAD